MKIAVSSTGWDMDSLIDERFGRCNYFVIVDPDTMEAETIENESAAAGGGAGTSAGQSIVLKGAEVVITGHCGPKALNVLNAADIKVVTGISGTVKEAVEKYKTGELS